MDIQIASNFERFLWYHEGRDPGRVREVMRAFRETGRYTFPSFDRGTFRASRADDAAIEEQVRRVASDFDYVVDPHTACGFTDLRPDRPAVVLGTAHPAKFPATLRTAIGRSVTHPRLEALLAQRVVKFALPAAPEAVRRFIAHRT